MGSPTKCFAEARKFLPPEVMADIETRAAELRAEGMSAVEAARAAVIESQSSSKARLDEIESGRAPVEAEQVPADPMERIRQQFPDLQVRMDDMDAPMRLDDFLASAKAEADEMAADAPLMQIAAECALLNG